MFLPAETDAVLKEGCCKKYLIKPFCLGGSNIIFVFWTKVIASYMIITSINIKKPCFKVTLIGNLCNREFGFHHFSNDI